MTEAPKVAKTSLTPPVAAIMLALVAFNAFAVDVYVATKNTGAAEPYDTPETAIVGLLPAQAYADALIAAGSVDKVRLLLAEGTYKITDELRLTNAIEVVGLGSDWDKVILQADHTGRSTSGTNGKRRVASLNNAQALICNVKFYNGDVRNETYGGGVAIIGNGGMVTNCHITGNSASGSHKCGGGAWINSDAALITHCLIDKNSGSGNGYKGNGGGVFALKGTIANCLITDNTALKGGGIAFGGVCSAGNLGSTARAFNCTIVANRATYSSSQTDSGYGGGVYCYGTGMEIVNCVLAENTATQTAATGYPEWHSTKDASGSFRNCAIGTSGGVVPALPDASLEEPTCFNFTPSWIEGYHVVAGSPLVNAGEMYEGVEDTDYDGNPRVKNGKIDIGCYENQDTGFSADPVPSAKIATQGDTLSFEAQTANLPAGAVLSYAWSLTAPEIMGAIVLEDTANPSYAFTIAGHYTVTLVATDTVSGAQSAASSIGFYIAPEEIYVATDKTEGYVPTFPYSTPATACASLYEAITNAYNRTIVRVLEGTATLSNMTKIEDSITITGAGAGKTTLRAASWGSTTSGAMFTLKNPGARIEKAMLCGRWGEGLNDRVTGVSIGIEGGTVADCVITNHTCGLTKGNAAGVFIGSPDGHVIRCVITGNRASFYGGGVDMENGTLEDCLITRNDSTIGGGVHMIGGTVRNCTVVSNRVWLLSSGGSASTYARGGGLAFGGGRVQNTVVAENVNLVTDGAYPNWSPIAVTSNGNPSGNPKNVTNCALPEGTDPVGSGCVIFDPEETFVSVGPECLDWHVKIFSALYKKGAYDAWMDGATDLDGRPRAHDRTSSGTKKVVDIGCYESDWLPPGMILLVK